MVMADLKTMIEDAQAEYTKELVFAVGEDVIGASRVEPPTDDN